MALRERTGTGFAAAVAAAAALLCRGLSYAAGPGFFGELATFLRVFLYLGLFFVWGVSVRRRVVQVQVRRYLLAVAALAAVWLVLRSFKWHLVTGEAALRRLWYAYHIFTLSIPLLALLVSLSLSRPEGYRLPRRAALLYVPTLCLIALALTNDLHQTVFRFPPEAAVWSEADYRYGPGFYALAGWGVVCAAAAFAVMLRRCRLPRTGRLLRLPLLCFAGAVLYVALYALGLPPLRTVFGDVTVSVCLLSAAFLESCVRCGLIPSNSRYSALFRASEGISARITDQAYRTRWAAKSAAAVETGDMRQAEAGPVSLPGGLRLHNMPVNGGHVVWTEDLSALLALREKLESIQGELNDRREILQMEYVNRRDRLAVEEQNRLYDLLQRQTQAQLDRAEALAAGYALAETAEEKRAILARIVVLGCYIKRRKDFALSMEDSPTLPAARLDSALAESFHALELLPAAGGWYVDAALGEVPGAWLARAYEFFEDVTESALDTAKRVTVRVGLVRGVPRCAVETDGSPDEAALRRKYPGLRALREAGGAEFLLPLDGEATV